ncbi:hypothetical protein [Burkholderia sp. BCC1981]|uniref:hypothetical protein n=1 Tax=Burkholderia sp. BCC1981 TaxID=2817441 RepID=UPI002ABD3BD3|nr:hypothetical protein [Burkholderia sp. BCC1981]
MTRQHPAAASDNPIATKIATRTLAPGVCAVLISAPKIATPNAEPLCLLALSTPAAMPARLFSTAPIIAAVTAACNAGWRR